MKHPHDPDEFNELKARLFALTIVLCGATLLLLLFVSCRSQSISTASTTRERQAHQYTATIQRTERSDTTLHPYRLHLTKYYHVPSGAIEREEIEQEGTILQMTEQSDTTTNAQQTDTLSNDTNTTTQEVTTAPTSPKETITSFIWGLLVGIALTIFTYLIIKLKKIV